MLVNDARSDEWRTEQLSTIGGSTAAAVLGKARFKTPLQLWKAMRAVLVDKRLPPPVRQTDDMRRGTVLEPYAREQLAEKYGVRIDPHDQDDFVHNPDLPWAHALPDGWIGDDLCEIKVPRPATVMRCNLEGLLPEWEIQAMHNLAVCQDGRRPHRCIVGLMDPMSCIVHDFVVPHDPAFANRLMQAEHRFHRSVLINQPPVDDFAQATEPELPPGKRLRLDDDESVELAETWFRLKAIATDLAEGLEITRGRIEAKMGAAPVAEIGNIARVWSKPLPPRSGFNKDVVLAKYPAIADDDECWKTHKPSRFFRVYQLGKQAR